MMEKKYKLNESSRNVDKKEEQINVGSNVVSAKHAGLFVGGWVGVGGQTVDRGSVVEFSR